MKMTITIWLLLITGVLFAQDHSSRFDEIDKQVASIDAGDPATLAALLTEPYKEEKEKVRAIFRWITEHIGYYRPSPFSGKRKKGTNSIEEGDEELLPGPLQPVTERVAIKVLRERKTFCDGYARLFKSLCDHACIRSEIITGYARSDINRVEEKFTSNHSWNAVCIDSTWYLLDATWASGFLLRSNGNFVRHYDDYYFLTPPADFIRHHYPDDLRWTLLSTPPPLYEFRYTPFRQRSYVKYDITDYYPTRGIIEAKIGDTIHVELATARAYRRNAIAPDSLWDSTALLISPNYTYISPETILPGNRVFYSFPVESEEVQWLHIMYNNDAVLRYRLNIKKEKEKK